MEVKAAEVVEGLDYGAKFTLRFPRAIRLRNPSEKTHEDAMTMKELKAFKQKSPKRDSTQVLEIERSKKLRTINGKQKMIASGLSDIVAQDLLFEGITFCLSFSQIFICD